MIFKVPCIPSVPVETDFHYIIAFIHNETIKILSSLFT